MELTVSTARAGTTACECECERGWEADSTMRYHPRSTRQDLAKAFVAVAQAVRYPVWKPNRVRRENLVPETVQVAAEGVA